MGVYGYDTKYGKIPEGYLDITIDNTKKKTRLYILQTQEVFII
jgi:hypothetical protein